MGREEVSHGKRERSSQQPFVVVPYVEREEQLEPAIKPRQCPRAPGGAACRVSWQGWRKRATGAVRRLRKARCRRHERYFTVYPCGQVPYGRRRVAPVEPGGRAVAVGDGEARSEAWREGLPGGGAGCRGGPAVGA